MRVAILGAGSIGTRHRATLEALDCAVTSFDAVPRAGVRPVGEWRAEDYDAAVICTSWDQHLVYAQTAIGAGVPIYVEKPLGPLTETAIWRGLAVLTEERGIVTQVGYQTRFHPMYQGMRRACPRPTMVRMHCTVDMTTWPGGVYGPVALEASHDLDLALACGAESRVVSLQDARGAYLRTWEMAEHGAEYAAVFACPAALGTDMYTAAMGHFVACVLAREQTDIPLSDGVRVLEAVSQMTVEDGWHVWRS